MNSADRRSRLRLTVMVCVLAAITLVTMDARNVGVVESAKRSLGNLLSGGDGALASLTSPVRNMWHGVTEYDRIKEQNGRLRERVAELRQQARDESLASAQLKELAALDSITLLSDYDSVTARRTTGPNGNWISNRAFIDVGTADGVTEDMPVMNADGLIGRIDQAYETTSEIRLISDVDLRFSVRIVETGTIGVGHGIGDLDRPWVIDQAVPFDADVSLGQQVVTAGIADSRFPPDIPVGTVSSIQPNDAENLTRVDVDPAVNLRNFDFVKVLLWTPGTTEGGGTGDEPVVNVGDSRGPADPFDPGASDVGLDPESGAQTDSGGN